MLNRIIGRFLSQNGTDGGRTTGKICLSDFKYSKCPFTKCFVFIYQSEWDKGKRWIYSKQNTIMLWLFVSPKPISSPIIICGAPRTLESPLFDKSLDKLSRYWQLLEHKSLSTSGIHRFGVDVQVRLKKDCYLHLFPIINVIFCFFFHCLSHQVSHNDC